MGGSYPLQVYLPESDMDMTVLTPDSENNDELNTVMRIFSCLCQAIKDNEKQNSLPFAVDDAEFKIQSIEFINARIKVVTCLINRMSVDITANQRNSLATATFLEEANRIIGHDGLFKQGILLVKCWCLHESAKYNNLKVSISGSKEGMFSSYALSILVLYLFNLVPTQLTTPFQVLRTFLETFSTFQFDKYVLTLDGPIPIQNGGSTLTPPLKSEKQAENRFRAIAERVHASLRPSKNSKDKVSYMTDFGTFRLRTCNIVDPVDPVNNLGVSVTWKNFWCFKSTLTTGLQHLNDSLLYMDNFPSNGTSLLPNANTNTNINTSPSPPPPSSQRKPVINMGGLGGTVNGIAPGLNFPSSTNSSTPAVALSSTNVASSGTNIASPPPVITLSPSDNISDIEIPPASLSPPSCMLTAPNSGNIAPAMSTSPAITGIAATSGISRGNSNGNTVTAPSPISGPTSTPVLPTNVVALAREFRFLKRFFPNSLACYQIEKAGVSSKYPSQAEVSSTINGNNNANGNSTYLSKLARSTSPFRDTSPVLHRIDRSHSVSCTPQIQQQQLQQNHLLQQQQQQLQTRPQSQPQLKHATPSRTISDTASSGVANGEIARSGSGNSTSSQAVSFLGGATIPSRMRSQSYTSLQSSGGGARRSNLDTGEPDEEGDDTEKGLAVSATLQGDLEAMWEALNYNYTAQKRDENSEDHGRGTMLVRVGSEGAPCDETDSSDTLTSVEESSPGRNQEEKESDTNEHFSSLDSSMHRMSGVGDESGSPGSLHGVSNSDACLRENAVGRTVKILSPRATASRDQALVKPKSPVVTHPAMPPLIKKMPPLTLPNSGPKQQSNVFSLLESPINRKVASENNIQAMNNGRNSHVNNAQSNNNSSTISNNTTSKSKRKKGKSKELVDSLDASNKNRNKKQTLNTDSASTTQDAANGDANANVENGRNAVANEENDHVTFWQQISLSQYLFGMVFVVIIVFAVLFSFGWFSSTPKPSVEMRSAYMKAHHHHAYQGSTTGSSGRSASRSSTSNAGSVHSEVMGSGFGKKAHSSLTTRNPLEKRLEPEEEETLGTGENNDDDDERNMSSMYDTSMKFDVNSSDSGDDERSGGSRIGDRRILTSSHSTFLEDADDLVNIAEMWLVKGQNVTLGLSRRAQDSYHRYMTSMKNRMLAAPGDDPAAATKHEGIWFKDSTPLMYSNSSLYLKVTNMNENTTGVYTFAIVKQKIRKGFSARPSGKVMRTLDANGRLASSAPPSSVTAVASVNGDLSIIDAKVDPASYEVIRVLARTVLQLGAIPSSKTKAMHLVLSVGSQLYLHLDVEGSPNPSIQWYKNGIALRKERKNVLIVNDVKKGHEGTYTCALINMAGKFVWLEATVLVNDN